MALKGLDIFKLSPKKNCKECGCPTCMAFCMKVAQGALPLEKCPYFAPDAVAKLSEATAPPMKTLEVGTGRQCPQAGRRDGPVPPREDPGLQKPLCRQPVHLHVPRGDRRENR